MAFRRGCHRCRSECVRSNGHSFSVPGVGACKMRTYRLEELRPLSLPELRSLLMPSRPTEGSVRTSWWLGLAEQLIAEIGRNTAASPREQVENARCVIRVISLLDESADMPPSGPAILMVDLGLATGLVLHGTALPLELTADSLALRCLDAARIDKAQMRDSAHRERQYLVDQLGQSDVSDADAEEFNRLDELRGIVHALKRLRSGMSDPELATRADEWIALESELYG